MKASLRKFLWAPAAGLGLLLCLFLCLWPLPLFTQSSALAPNAGVENLEACKAGRAACDSSKLSATQLTEVAVASHGRNVANCRNGYDSCDHSKLSEPEAEALAVANHKHNVADCNEGMQSCDPAKLTPAALIELQISVGFYIMTSKFLETFGIDMQPVTEVI